MCNTVGKIRLAEALSEMGVIHIPGDKRKHWDVEFYLEYYYTHELRDLYNKRAVRRNTNDR